MNENLMTATVVLPRTIGARTTAAALLDATLTESPDADAIVIDASGNQAISPSAIDECVKRSMEHLGWDRIEHLQLIGAKPETQQIFDEQVVARTPR